MTPPKVAGRSCKLVGILMVAVFAGILSQNKPTPMKIQVIEIVGFGIGMGIFWVGAKLDGINSL
jgi:hypothetical protein